MLNTKNMQTGMNAFDIQLKNKHLNFTIKSSFLLLNVKQLLKTILSLGAPVCAEHRWICGAMADINGLQGLSCKKSKGRTARHTAVNGVIKWALLSAEIPKCLEPAKLSHCDNKRPVEVSTMPWSRGQSLPRGAAEDRQYVALSKEFQFIPIAIGTLGPFGEEVTRFLQELGRRIEAVTRDSRSMSFILQCMSVAVQKGNAACFRHRTLRGGGHFGLFVVFYFLFLNVYS